MSGKHRRPRQRRPLVIGMVCTLLALGAAVGVVSVPAVADTPYTFTEQKFDGATFPPTDWSTPDGTWTQDCPSPEPASGCTALATVTDPTPGVQSNLEFNPATQIPANLQNATFTFTSDWNPDAGNQGDNPEVLQASVNGQTGDFAFLFQEAISGDTPGVATTHTVPLANLNLPIVFRWTSFGDASSTPNSTWGISDVSITGTLPSIAYTLTADPIPNTTYPHVVAGTPVTITLSGSSDPTGDSLDFQITSAPSVGTLGDITPVDATHAHVTYTTDATACPDPNGVAGFLCIDQFQYKATDAQGNESTPVTATLDVHPGGPGDEQLDVTAPTSVGYTTLVQGGVPTQAVDLSGAVEATPNGFPDEVEVHLHASTGSMNLINADASGVTYVNGTANNAADVQFKASIGKVNTALGLFIFNPPDGTTPAATIDIYAADLGAEGQAGFIPTVHKTINIQAVVNVPAPVLNLPTGPLSVVNTQGPLTFPAGAATGISITDGGATSSTNDTVALHVSDGDLNIPAADTGGPSPLVTATHSLGELTLIGTVDNLNTALEDVTFDPSGVSGNSVQLSGLVTDPDTGLGSPSTHVDITVVHAPTLFGTTSISTQQNVATTVFLCADGPAGSQLGFTITGAPSHGALVADPNANPATSGCSSNATTLIKGYTYTPATDYIGADHFDYKVTDANTGLDTTGGVDINVTAHTKPTAYDVNASTRQDTAVDITLCGQNPDPSPALTFQIDLPPGLGTLTAKGTPPLNPCNNGNTAFTYTYTPNPGAFTSDGTDGFTYNVTNGAVSDDATVTITVATRTPHVAAVPLTVDENSSVGFQLCATVPNGPLTFSIVGPTHGTLDTQSAAQNEQLCPPGFLPLQYERYVPTPFYVGSDSIAVSATDGTYTSTQVQIPITVNFVEIPPSADDKTVLDIAPQPANVTLTGSSPNNLPITFRVVSGPAHGILSGTVPNLVYTPSIGSGTDSFTYVANDGNADGPPATVHITITTPRLSSDICLAASPLNNDCAGTLATVPDGSGGLIPLAHTSGSGTAGDQVLLQVAITNNSAATDHTTLTAAGAATGWTVRYDFDGQDVTDDMVGAGVPATIPANSTSYVQVVVLPPIGEPPTPSIDITVHAQSGNSATVTTDQPMRVMAGTSSPSLAMAQSDGSGQVTFPTGFTAAPPMYVGGPNGGARVVPGMTSTTGPSSSNTFTIAGQVEAGSLDDLGVQFFLGSANDVTARVLAGTLSFQCFKDIGCPTLRVVLTPGSTGGHWEMELTQTSTIDGQSTQIFFGADVAGSVGPDFYTTPPRLGAGVFEPTPVTQTVGVPVQEQQSATKRVILRSNSSVSDTFTVSAASTGTGSVTITASPPNDGSTVPGPAVDVTSAVFNGTYKVTMNPGDEVDFYVTVQAGASAGSNAASVVLTASSKLAPSRVDSYEVHFPTFSYRPDLVLTGPDGDQIGANVYESDNGYKQSADFQTSLTPITVTTTILDRGVGPQTSSDSVTIKQSGPVTLFDITYTLNGTDVTSQVQGSGLTVPDGSAQKLLLHIASDAGAPAGHPANLTLTAVSAKTGLIDAVQANFVANGASQLRFGGLPQPEPPDITTIFANTGDSRTDPIPSRGYSPGVYYGAYPDPAGNKFVYDSAFDTFDLQVFAENLTATRYSLRVSAPGASSTQLPVWERDVFGHTYNNAGSYVLPADPLAADGVHPHFTVNGADVTNQVLSGNWTTSPLLATGTANVSVSFTPASDDSRRYAPLRIALVDNSTGKTVDVLVLGLSTIVECSPDALGQEHIAAGGKHLNFRSFDRTRDGDSCLQHLTHSWITRTPMVFSSDDNGTDNPSGLWLLPQQNAIIRVDTDSLAVTSPIAKAYVDTSLLGDDGLPDPTTYRAYNYIGTFPQLTWNTTDGTNGLEVGSSTVLPPSPFPLIAPSKTAWPNNTMLAERYFQVDTTTGTPVMVGTMAVNEPWFHGDVDLDMRVDSDTGLVLDYAAPPDVHASLPGNDDAQSYGMFWMTRKDGVVIQGGCLGLPPAFFKLLGLNTQYCLIEVTTTFEPIPDDPSVEAKIAQITFTLKIKGVEVGTPTFNLKELDGEIDLDPASGDVTKVVASATFGVGPVTPCYAAIKSRPAGTVVSKTQAAQDKLCPKNYFTFKAQITFQQGGFYAADSSASVGVRFLGTLSFLNLVQLTSVEADVTTEPFNFHFANSPIDLSVDAGIPITANITFDGDIGELGFDIGVSGSITVMGQTIASASGRLSTKGMGLCAGLAGVSVGFEQPWDSNPTFYPSGCSTDQLKVTS